MKQSTSPSWRTIAFRHLLTSSSISSGTFLKQRTTNDNSTQIIPFNMEYPLPSYSVSFLNLEKIFYPMTIAVDFMTTLPVFHLIILVTWTSLSEGRGWHLLVEQFPSPLQTKVSATGGLKAKKAAPSIIGAVVGKTGVSEKTGAGAGAESKSLHDELWKKVHEVTSGSTKKSKKRWWLLLGREWFNNSFDSIIGLLPVYYNEIVYHNTNG